MLVVLVRESFSEPERNAVDHVLVELAHAVGGWRLGQIVGGEDQIIVADGRIAHGASVQVLGLDGGGQGIIGRRFKIRR